MITILGPVEPESKKEAFISIDGFEALKRLFCMTALTCSPCLLYRCKPLNVVKPFSPFSTIQELLET